MDQDSNSRQLIGFTRRGFGLALAVLLAAGIAGGAVLLKQNQVFSFSDETAGLIVSLPSTYEQEFREDKEKSDFNRLIAHFVRTSPPALITLRYETGIRQAASLLRRNILEHFTYEIQQFFPVKYAEYKPELLETREIAGKDSLEHVFQYTDKDGIVMKTRLFIVPWDEDIAYYLILQAKEQDFKKVASDLNVLAKTLQVSGPQTQKPNEE